VVLRGAQDFFRAPLSLFIPALVAGLLLSSAGCSHLTRGYRGPTSDHFDGTRFVQPEPLSIGFWDWVKRELTKHRGPWRTFTPADPAPCPPSRVEDGRLRVTWVNHGTVLVQMDGANLLFDPTWAERSFPTVGPRRRRPPGIPFEDLPPIDAVLISHDHQDHMDLPTLRRLSREHGPVVFVGLGNASYLARKGVTGVRELDWWGSEPLAPGLTVTAVPARHMSGRGLFDADRTLWCGWVVSGLHGSVYDAGDTGVGRHFAEIAARFPDLRLALLPIGGFQPPWYMREQHLGPRDALDVQGALGGPFLVPVHFGTFPQSDDAELEPPAELRRAVAERPAPRPPVALLDNGGSVEVPSLDSLRAGARRD